MIEGNNEPQETASMRFKSFGLNCSVGDHRLQRLHYVQDGTQAECLALSRRSFQNRWHVNYEDSLLSEEDTINAHAKERSGEIVTYPLPQSIFQTVTAVNGSNDFGSFEIGDENENRDFDFRDISLLAFLFQNEHVCFDATHNYIHLHDSFPLDIVRSVFTTHELLRIKHMLDNSSRCLFFLPSITQHLARNPDRYVLCEVDFGNMRIIFYHNDGDNYNTLTFYAEALWNQFVLPTQQKQWRVHLFLVPNTIIATLFIIAFARMSNQRIRGEQLNMTHIVSRARHTFGKLVLASRVSDLKKKKIFSFHGFFGENKFENGNQ